MPNRLLRNRLSSLVAAASLGIAAVNAAPCALLAQAQHEPMLIPKPSDARRVPGTFTLSSPVRIVVPAASRRLAEMANLLADVIRRRTGFAVRVATSGPARGAIVIDTAFRSPNAEAYETLVHADGIAVHGASSAGALWGVQTLRQLLPPDFEDVRGARPSFWSIPAMEIRDAPRFGWRGSMVDAGRHFFPVAAIERHIDVLSRYKMNVFHWHLTDDQGWRIEIRRYPRLTGTGAWRTEADGSRYGGFYTQRQIRDVVEYARVRGVTVVPEIEMPGHSSAALASYPELGCTGRAIPVPVQWGVFSDIFCAGNERTFTFLTNVLDEVLALFPSRYIHIGGDEVPKERWQACAPCQDVMRREGLANEAELQSWFVRRIGAYLSAHGRRLIGWDEVLQGGLVEGATVQAWEDTSFTRSAVESGHDVIASPAGWTYLNRSAGDLPLDRVLAFEPVPPSLDSAAALRVLGGEAALWSEHITSPANLDMMAFPRMLALAEVMWSGSSGEQSGRAPRGTPRDLAEFSARLNGDHIARLQAMGVAVGPADRDIARIRFQFDTVANVGRLRTEIGAPGVVVRGTADGSAPRSTSPEVADNSLLAGEGMHRLQPFYGSVPVLSERVVTLVRNDALGKPVQLATPPSPQYRGTGARNLTDGLAGSTDHADGLWQGWWGDDMGAIVDLQSARPIDSVRVTFLQNVRAWIVLPASVEFQVSDDSTSWRIVASIESNVPVEREGVILHSFSAVANTGTRARYVRVVARNAGPLPAWHPGAGRPSWLFADEIVVR